MLTQLKIVMEWNRNRHQVPSYRSILRMSSILIMTTLSVGCLMFGYNRLFRNPAQAYTLPTVLWSQDVAQNLTTRFFKLEKGCVCFFSYFCDGSYWFVAEVREHPHAPCQSHDMATWTEQLNSTQNRNGIGIGIVIRYPHIAHSSILIMTTLTQTYVYVRH